jgi:hypothetical protein
VPLVVYNRLNLFQPVIYCRSQSDGLEDGADRYTAQQDDVVKDCTRCVKTRPRSDHSSFADGEATLLLVLAVMYES